MTMTTPAQATWSQTGTITYSGDELDKIVVTQTDGTNTSSETTNYDYSSGRLSKVTWTDGTDTNVTEYKYEDNKFSKVTNTYTSGTTSNVMTDTYAYNDKGQLDTVTSVGGGTTTLYNYTFKDDQIDSISVASTTFAFDYDSDKRIDTVTQTTSGNTDITAYTYESGDVDGIIPNPEVPYGDSFDMKGELVDMGKDVMNFWTLPL